MTEKEKDLMQQIADLQKQLSGVQSGAGLQGLQGLGEALASQVLKNNSENSLNIETSQVRGRGRPRRNPAAVAPANGSEMPSVEKRGRGRPPKTGVKLVKVKNVKLPALLQQISKENSRGLTVIEFTEKVKTSNYKHSSNDIGNMVYQCLRRMVKANVFQQVIEGDKRLYTLVS